MAGGKPGNLFMVKYLLNFLLIFSLLSVSAFAKNEDAKLQEEFGSDLTHVPFFLRFAFSKEFNKDWKKSNYPQREAFLRDYESNLAAQQKQEKIETQALAQKNKEILLEKKEEQHREKDRLKARLEKERAEEKAEKERQKEFSTLLNEQQKELNDMRQQATQTGR